MAPEQPAVPDPPAKRWHAATTPTGRYQGVTASSAARNRKALILAAVILALAGAIAAWVFYPQSLPATALITIPVREYNYREFPANAFALQDSELLLRHFPEELRTNAYTSQTRDLLLNVLSDVSRRTNEALVLHLRAHAVRDDSGVYLFPADADPGNRGTWVPLQDVLDVLHKCPVAHKLLLLDLMRPLTDPKLGILTNDVAEGVKATLDREPNRGLFVLASCAPGQVSLVSDDLHLSVFAYYLDQGLNGHADGFNATGDRDGRVTVSELAKYVRKQVNDWARRNRGTTQTPVLYGTGADFVLVGYEREEMPPVAELPAAEPLPDWLGELWKTHDSWQATEVFHRAPRAFQQFETLVLRAEAQWRTGLGAGPNAAQENQKEVARIREDLDEHLGRVKQQVDASVERPRRELHALVLARGPGKTVDPAVVTALRGLLDKVAPDANVKPEEVVKTKEALQKQLKDTSYADLAAAVFETAATDPALTIKKLRLLQGILDERRGQPRYVETVYLQRLVGLAQKVEDKEWPWKVEVVNQLLRTVQEEERAAAADPASLPWIDKRFQSADDKRRRGEKLFFTERYPSWPQALALLQEAEQAYRAINADLDTLARARQLRDEALAFLPGYVPYLKRLHERDSDEVRTWRSGVQAALDLYDNTMTKPGQTDPATIDGLRSTARGYLLGVQGSFHTRLKRFLSLGDQATVADFADFPRLLASPRLDAKQRETLWLAGRKLARQLLTQPRPSGDVDIQAAAGNPARQAQLAIDLLKLGGLTTAGRLQDALAKAKREPSDALWRSLGGELYTAWAKELPEQLQAARADLTRADRLSRITDLLDQNRGTDLAVGARQANPTAEIRRQQVARYWQWLGQRYQAEGKALGVDTSAGAFFVEAAADYLR